MTKMDAIWDIGMKKLAEVLISPHTPEMDKLLAKFAHRELSFDEKRRLIELLKQEAEECKREHKMQAAIAVLLITRLEGGH